MMHVYDAKLKIWHRAREENNRERLKALNFEFFPPYSSHKKKHTWVHLALNAIGVEYLSIWVFEYFSSQINGNLGYESNLSYNTRHISWGSTNHSDISVPSMLIFAGWHHKIKAKDPTLGGKEHNVLPQYSLRSKRFRLVSEHRKTEHGLWLLSLVLCS